MAATAPLLPRGRLVWVIAHRWAGLTMALFLIVAGATGALLPFMAELTLASRPALSAAAPPAPGARPLDGATLAERVERQAGGRVSGLSLDIPSDHIASVSVEARPGRPALGYDTVWADPYTGKVRLAYRDGVPADGPQAIPYFLLLVHYGLVLGEWGRWAFGVAALVWTIDCFVGFYLTLPVRPKRAVPSKSWWSRWRPAWTLRKGARGHKLTFDLHRAGGLWLWPVMVVFAWSGVGFSLTSVHAPVMHLLGGTEWVPLPVLAEPLDPPPIGMRAAVATGERLMGAEAARRGFTVERPGYFSYDAGSGLYRYGARTSLDVVNEGGRTNLWFSGVDGRLVRFTAPIEGSAADKTTRWFEMLHMAQVFGLPYRIFVSMLGLAVAALSVTGILIWMRKRSARLLGKRRAPRSRKLAHGVPAAAK